jgi:hypothetical protein
MTKMPTVADRRRHKHSRGSDWRGSHDVEARQGDCHDWGQRQQIASVSTFDPITPTGVQAILRDIDCQKAAHHCGN